MGAIDGAFVGVMVVGDAVGVTVGDTDGVKVGTSEGCRTLALQQWNIRINGDERAVQCTSQ